MARTKKKAPAPLDPALTLEQVGPGYWSVWFYGERIGDVRGTTAGDPGLPPMSQRDCATKNEAANHCLSRYLHRPRPASCMWCHEETNTMFLGQNHGGGMGALNGGVCMGMYLTRNHVAYALARDNLDQLEGFITRAEQLWRHAPVQERRWLDDAHATLLARRERTRPPEHASVLVATEEAALW
ncbi:MAG: hypothetical protein CMF72_24595 [Mameliella sp.]|nr:hypothetical protein [Mameliella sp.]